MFDKDHVSPGASIIGGGKHSSGCGGIKGLAEVRIPAAFSVPVFSRMDSQRIHFRGMRCDVPPVVFLSSRGSIVTASFTISEGKRKPITKAGIKQGRGRRRWQQGTKGNRKQYENVPDHQRTLKASRHLSPMNASR